MGRISIQERSMIRSAKRSQDGFVLEVSGSETIEAKFVIDGAGAHSPFSRHVAGLDMDPKHHCAGVRGYYEGVKGLDTEGFIELHFVKEALPGYFWIFPLPNGQANVGLGIRTDLVSKRRVNVKALLARVIETAPGIKERFEQAELLGNIKGFPLPLGSKRRRISGNGYLLVGDAAHLIDPFTGEGISNAMISGRHAAQVYAEGIREGDLSAKRLREYDERVFKRLGQELRLSSRLQRLAQKPRLFDLVVNKATRNKELQRTISSMFDDIDLREQLRKPSFYYKVLFG